MAAMTSGRIRVDAPAIKPAPGIFDVVTPQELGANEIHQLMGVEYESAACIPVNFVALDPDSCIATEEKEFEGLGFEQGDPFHIYAGVECNLFGSTEADYAQKAQERLELGEQRAAEQALWDQTFRQRAVNLTPAGGAVSPAAALGLLEEYAGNTYGGVPVIHAGRRLSVLLAAKSAVKGSETVTGSDFVNGAGYFGVAGPDDEEAVPAPIVAGENEAWMYVTGAVSLRRGPARIHNAVSTVSNDRIALAERTYVPTVDCMVGAILVTLE